MENASKALIIAGAILLSILIIGLGMTVYNNARSSVGTANLDATEISAHNSKFLSYEGRQKGTQVNALITAIRKNNKEFQDRMIKINFSSTTDVSSGSTRDTNTGRVTSMSMANASTKVDPNTTYNQIFSKVQSTTTYFVTFGYSDNGCIAGVDVHVYSDAD